MTHKTEPWFKRHALQLAITAFLVVGGWYSLEGRVGAVEEKVKTHAEQEGHPGAASEEEVKDLRGDMKDVVEKVNDLALKQGIMQNDVGHMKDAIDRIERAVTGPQ